MVDAVDLQIHLSPACGQHEILSAIMDLCASIGFETMGMNLPIVTEANGLDSSSKHHLYVGLDHELKANDNENTLSYYVMEKDELDLIRSIRKLTCSLLSRNGTSSKENIKEGFSKRRGFNLFNSFSDEGFYEVSIENPLSFFLPYKILLFSHFRTETAMEAANFAARLGLESLQLSLPLTFSPSIKNYREAPLIYIGKKEDLKEIGLKNYYENVGFGWDSGIFLVPAKKKIPDVLICGDEEGLQGILGYLSTLPENSKGPTDSILKEMRRFTEDLKAFISKPSFLTPHQKKIVRSYPITSEKEEVIRILKRELKKVSSEEKSLNIEIIITRPEKERKRFAVELRRLFENLGDPQRKIHLTVLNGYKPGLSWMREVVLGEIAKKKADRIEIAFKPFREKGLEEPVRWLQEIYPIDEIFARKLGIAKERIEFKKVPGMKEVYRVRAWRRGNRVYEAQFSPRWRRMNYLIPFPRLGKVHPCMGWINVKKDGKEMIDQEVRSGYGQIWEIYQREILPLIQKEVDHLSSRMKFSSGYPVFEEVRFDIHFNYPMEELGVDEERISPLEALHEDLYFVTLDFFDNYLKRKGMSKPSAGRILPVIHPDYQEEKGRLEFTLLHREPVFGKNKKVNISLNGLAFRGSDRLVDLSIKAGNQRNFKWLRDRIKSFQSCMSMACRIERVFEERKPRAGLRIIAIGSDPMDKKPIEHKEKINPSNIPMERPIGYKEGLNLIHSLKGLPGVNIVEEGLSSGGLPIYSIEHTYPCPSRFVSHRKRAVLKPTLFINCRHHANEVSSTNAGLKLSYFLATRPRFQRLLRKVNVVINPMENVDGVAVLEEMLTLTPKDKLHAGRYNRAGQEYYSEYFNPETPFGEARVKTKIWSRWLPDICADNHGFPSHEWEQPFSGYAPFRFREWWIPRTFFFFYLPFLEAPKRSSQRIQSEAFGKRIWAALVKEKGVMKWNRIFSERYQKYRGQWIASHLEKDSRKQYLSLQKRFRQTNYSYRYPHITTIDFITEVADEIAHGRFLRDCVSSHLKTNLTIITLLNSTNFLVNKKCRIDRKGVHAVWYRKRPIQFGR